MKTTKTMTLAEILAIHINATGPVSFSSCVNYAEDQWSNGGNRVEDYIVAAELNKMLRAGTVELYDDGMSFVSGPEAR